MRGIGILKGLDEKERWIEAGDFEWRTDKEDMHMNIEAVLTDLIGEPIKTQLMRIFGRLNTFRLWTCSLLLGRIPRVIQEGNHIHHLLFVSHKQYWFTLYNKERGKERKRRDIA